MRRAVNRLSAGSVPLPLMDASSVAVANAKVSIATAAALVGVPARAGKSKTYCPFGDLSHPDGGSEPALRLYDDNKAWCFSCEKMWTPVSLCAEAWDVDPEAAAERLLAHIGWRPGDYAAAWEHATQPEPIDAGQLRAALRMRLAREHAGWESLQYDADIAGCLAKCLTLLTLVTDNTQARQWLDGCALAVTATLARRNHDAAGGRSSAGGLDLPG